MKVCRACGAEKPTDQFHKDRSKPDGLNAYCKPCTRSRVAEFAKRPPKKSDPEGQKTCQGCKALKPTSDYYAASGQWDGLQKRCKTCSAAAHDAWRRKNLGKVATDAKRRRASHQDRYADYNLKQNYGLEPGDYDRMLAEQNGRCAICETDATGRNRRFHVDHCHETGSVRGLLCHGCNVSLGHFKHSEEVLKSAIRYLAEGRRVRGDAFNTRKKRLVGN